MNAHDKWLQAPYEAAAIDHEALQAEIAAEADARLIEWQDVAAAGRDAHGYELLVDDIEFILANAAKQMAASSEDSLGAMAVLGYYVASKVRRAAFKVATHVCADRVAA